MLKLFLVEIIQGAVDRSKVNQSSNLYWLDDEMARERTAHQPMFPLMF